MAINKKTTPLSTPDNFASPVINQLAALLTVSSSTKRASGGYILKGALFNIGGSMFMADSDTAISGTASDYIKLTVSGDTATAAYVTNISGVSWNGAYQGCFDSSGNLYITDEQYGIHPPYTVLSGSGTYTVPPNVFVLHVKMYGPGSDGSAGGTFGGSGGASGGLYETDIDVTPMDTYSYSVTTTSTVFGAYTATKGTGIKAARVEYGTSGAHGGGYGGGSGGGSGGTLGRNGGSATGTYGGGGGGGGASTSSIIAGSGGSGALGRVELS